VDITRNVTVVSLLVTVLLCGTACRKSPTPAKPDGAPASDSGTAKTTEQPVRAAPKPAWKTKTALDMVTFQIPDGAGWSYGFEMAWHGGLDAPNAVFAVRSGDEVKNLIESSAAVSKGDVTIAGRQATLQEGTEKDWGPVKLWVLKEAHPSSGSTVALIVAGHEQAAFREDLDAILASVKIEPVSKQQ